MKLDPGKTELWNCENAFDFVCPRRWESLGQTESPEIRYCDVCRQNVYLCETPLEFVRQGNLGRCVAIGKEVAPTGVYVDYSIGRYSKEGMEQMHNNYEREERWWKEVLALDATFNTEEMEDIRQRYGIPK